jgi:hypothetical protein
METETAFVIWTLLVWVGGFATGLVVSTRKGRREDRPDGGHTWFRDEAIAGNLRCSRCGLAASRWTGDPCYV